MEVKKCEAANYYYIDVCLVLSKWLRMQAPHHQMSFYLKIKIFFFHWTFFFSFFFSLIQKQIHGIWNLKNWKKNDVALYIWVAYGAAIYATHSESRRFFYSLQVYYYKQFLMLRALPSHTCACALLYYTRSHSRIYVFCGAASYTLRVHMYIGIYSPYMY